MPILITKYIIMLVISKVHESVCQSSSFFHDGCVPHGSFHSRKLLFIPRPTGIKTSLQFIIPKWGGEMACNGTDGQIQNQSKQKIIYIYFFVSDENQLCCLRVEPSWFWITFIGFETKYLFYILAADSYISKWSLSKNRD